MLTPFVWFFLVKLLFWEREILGAVGKSTIFCEMIVCVELTHKIKGENVAYILTQMVGNFFFILTHWMRSLKCGKKSDLKIPFRYQMLKPDMRWGCNCTLTIYFPCRSNKMQWGQVLFEIYVSFMSYSTCVELRNCCQTLFTIFCLAISCLENPNRTQSILAQKIQ